MELTAKVSKDLNQIRIFKKLTTFSTHVGLTDAKHLVKKGVVTKTNKCFDRLVDNDFDVEKTLAWYQEERERIKKDRERAGTQEK